MRYGWIWLCMLLAAEPCLGQTVDELKSRLAEREAEAQQLREMIEALERQSVPASSPAPSAPAAEDVGDINRALERALVRQGGLLLSPGTVELELNFSYSHASRESVGFHRDAFGPALAVRVGLPFDTQFSAEVPYVFEHRETASGSNSGDGIGDISVGVSHQFALERTWVPNLIGAIGYKFATGKNTLFTSPQPIAFGSGFNALQASLTATKRSDPLVFFGSYAYSHNFSDQKGANTIDIGDSHDLRFGTFLATSPTTSLRLAFDIAFFEKTRVNDVPIAGTAEPAGIIEVGGSFLFGDRTLFDLAVGAGLTSSAPDFRITGAIPVRF